MSSADCQSMIEMYQGYKDIISKLIKGSFNCIDEITKGSQIMEIIIVSGKSIDDGLLESLSSFLSEFIEILSILSVECDNMVTKYETLKDKILISDN